MENITSHDILDKSLYGRDCCNSRYNRFSARIASTIYVLSDKIMLYWEFRVNRFDFKEKQVNKRIVRSVQPMGFYMQGLGYLTTQTKTKIFTTIILNASDIVVMLMNFIK